MRSSALVSWKRDWNERQFLAKTRRNPAKVSIHTRVIAEVARPVSLRRYSHNHQGSRVVVEEKSRPPRVTLARVLAFRSKVKAPLVRGVCWPGCLALHAYADELAVIGLIIT